MVYYKIFIKTTVVEIFFFDLASLIMIVRLIQFFFMATVCLLSLRCIMALHAYTTIYLAILFLMTICVVCPSGAIVNSAAMNIIVHIHPLVDICTPFSPRKWAFGLYCRHRSSFTR